MLPRSNQVGVMKIDLDIDDRLLEAARRASGLTEAAELLQEGLKALIERESAQRVARQGSTEPQLEPISRRC